MFNFNGVKYFFYKQFRLQDTKILQLKSQEANISFS